MNAMFEKDSLMDITMRCLNRSPWFHGLLSARWRDTAARMELLKSSIYEELNLGDQADHIRAIEGYLEEMCKYMYRKIFAGKEMEIKLLEPVLGMDQDLSYLEVPLNAYAAYTRLRIYRREHGES